jgi:hypothetical protein
MKITNITKEYYEVDGEKIYFFEPLEKVISIKELQKIMDTAEEVVNKLKEGKNYEMENTKIRNK